MAWPGNRVQQIVIAKLSLRLSLNNPSNIIWHCSKEICHTTTERERERELEREREIERERERKKERRKEGKKERNKEGRKEREKERASELDAKCYGNCKQGNKGWLSLIGFARSVIVHNSICLAYAKSNGLSCMVPGYRFWGGPIASQCFVHNLWQTTPAILK